MKLKNFNKNYHKETILKKIHYYSEFLNIEPTPQNIKDKKLNIGSILDDYIFDGFAYEANLIPLPRNNYQSLIKYSDIDFILVNSLLEDVTGTWRINDWQENLKELLQFCKKYQIPTVFWFTKGFRYLECFSSLLKNFDYIYCADDYVQKSLEKEGIKVEILKPCVQPLIFNPLIEEPKKNSRSTFIFDGWADIDRFETIYDQILDKNIVSRMEVIESRCLITRNRVDGLSKYSNCTLGNVISSQKAKLLSYSRMLVLGEESINDLTALQWFALQGMASRIPTLILCKDPFDSPKPYSSLFVGGQQELTRLLDLFDRDELLRQRFGHLSMREALENNTFAHRLDKITVDLGLFNKRRAQPIVSIVTPTRRLDNVDFIVENFLRQRWPNKELILVANLDKIPKDFKKAEEIDVFAKVPQDCFAGEALNEGISRAKGKYIFRFDDDDIYGASYCYDMVLAAEAWEIDFLGKVRSLFYSFEGESIVYCLNPVNDNVYLSALPYKTDTSAHSIGVTGNSFAGKRCFFINNPFFSGNYSAADIFFQENTDFNSKRVLKTDSFNVLVGRRIDQSTHTWKTDVNELKSRARKAGGIFYSSKAAFV